VRHDVVVLQLLWEHVKEQGRKNSEVLEGVLETKEIHAQHVAENLVGGLHELHVVRVGDAHRKGAGVSLQRKAIFAQKLRQLLVFR